MDKVILIDKPAGLSSHETVALVKRRLGIKKAGHTGTLDPIATGLLIVCTGEATKAARYLTDLPKKYLAVVKIGERTSTFDAEGAVIATGPVPADGGAVQEALARFRGAIRQVPPMYSALKVSGKPLYRLARQGIEVAREQREVHVSELELLGYDPPYAQLHIACSKGTYIRALADDIGVAAGTFAHIVGLRRTMIGPFSVEDSVEPESLGIKTGAGKDAALDIDQALAYFMDEIRLDSANLQKALNGAPFRTDLPVSGLLKIKDQQGRMLGIGQAMKGLVRVERLFNLFS